MTPERWRQVKSALSEAMALGGAERTAYLDRLGGEDPDLRTEVESLLAAEQGAGSRFLETPAPAALGDSPADAEHALDPLIGQRLGPYRLLTEIGSGGMGRVYRAVRADDEYRQEVAIKLVRAGADAGFVAQRLRAERQILASLAHPFIARLLDGGTTADGVPYLVMELIAGEPITDYCEERRLDVTARLELFLLVCSAVQYAHQHMVIHRDLKPSNILVTAEGTPKLLDFGIAKLLEPGAFAARADATVNTLRVLTPDYASPEQIKGETVTAASDVYSLGIVLHELLTGTRPSIGAAEPKKPSTLVGAPAGSVAEGSPEKLRRRLRGDLDNIVLMALRREPERRYGSVDRLADDIRRHLTHRPVSARRPTLRYRATTFVARHGLAATTAAVIAAALIGGMLITLHEARVAQAQRARADRRFNDVRQLATTLILDVHDSIRDLPGAEGARRLLIDTAVHYLDSLSQEAAGDPSLQRELAAAYQRLGDLQGRAREANEGDYAGAQRSYRRAFDLLEASLAPQPDDPGTQRDLIITCGKLSDLLWSQNDAAGALSYSQQTVTRSRRVAGQHAADRTFRYFLAASLLDHGYKLFAIRGDTADAMSEMRQSVADLEALHASNPRDPFAARTLALGYSRLGDLLEYQHDHAQALALYQKERALLVAPARAAPRNADLAHLLAFAELDLGGTLAETGRLDEAVRHEQAALDSFNALATADPQIAEYRQDVGMTLVGLARIAGQRGQPRRAIALLEQALAQMQTARRGPANDSSFEIERANAELLTGDEYALLRQRQQSREHYERALATYRQVGGAWFEATAGAKEAADKIQRSDAAMRQRL